VTDQPRWIATLLRALAPSGEAGDVLGDLEEAHRSRSRRYGRRAAGVMRAAEALDMAFALVRAHVIRFKANKGNSMLQDYKLGVRMLVKYPGLTLAGGLALAIAIGLGAGWYDLMHEFWRPQMPLPQGDRIVEIEMRDPRIVGDEHRILHDFLIWRQDLRSVEELGAYRTLQRNLALGEALPEPVNVAEINASAFRLAGVPPLLGRPLIDADERPGAPDVVVLGYYLWQQRLGGRADVVGRELQLGTVKATVVGVMPEGFAFPVNHSLWTPLRLRPSGYAPLEGAAVRVFGRLAPGATQAQANVEVVSLVARTKASSPRTHEHLRPRVLAYGGESPGDRSIVETAVTHLPILLVLIVACANVATLVYARTATRDAEIAMRYALGASRGRIITQLFVEALVLASAAAVAGLAAANWALKWGVSAFYSGRVGELPFWVNPGLKPMTIVYAAALTVTGAAILGVLPAIRVTGSRVQVHLRSLGGGSTLRFGRVWTTVMIAQVALTVICLPPAIGMTTEAVRDRMIRARFPAGEYLAVTIELDRQAVPDGPADEGAAARRMTEVYGELEARIAQEPGVRAITFGDGLPGMEPNVFRGEVETAPGAAPTLIPNLWTASVGAGYFEAFDRPIVAGRSFHDGDRTPASRTVIVNEAFARRYLGGATPIGTRVRFAASGDQPPEAWMEIVGMVRDIGMTPTDFGEAPYVFRAASPATISPAVMAIRVNGDPALLAPRVRVLAAGMGANIRLTGVGSLDALAWRADIPMVVMAGTMAATVGLGLFLSSAGIFSLMSVSVARRTREIGLRAALGASPARLLVGIFSRALILIGSGIAAGDLVLILAIVFGTELQLVGLLKPLSLTSALMLTAGLLACVEPARRALKIAPTDALKEA
jgi:predicted permease